MADYTHEQVVTELVLGGDMPVSELRDLAAKHMRELQALNAELLAALKETVDWIANWDPNFTYDDEWQETADRVDAVIKKAESQ